jgi:universal stress protein A
MMTPDVFPIPASDSSRPAQRGVPSADAQDELTYSRILVPIDFSEYSKRSISYAARFASRYNATLLLVHVFESGYAVSGHEDVKPSIELLKSQAAGAEQAAQDSLAVIENQLQNRGIKTEAHHRAGCPFYEIVKTANDLNIDLIIIGSHGRTGLSHLLLGSVAERVVEHAQCPVLVLKQKGK